MSLNIAGALKRTDKDLDRFFQDESGKYLNGSEARDYLLQCKSEGKRILPIGECEGFDFQNGCPGHDSKTKTI
jgi:hypothetical protein